MMPIRIGRCSCQHQSFKCRAPFYLFGEKKRKAKAFDRANSTAASHCTAQVERRLFFPRPGSIGQAENTWMHCTTSNTTPHCVAHLPTRYYQTPLVPSLHYYYQPPGFGIVKQPPDRNNKTEKKANLLLLL
jgi:hypothetical protein